MKKKYSITIAALIVAIVGLSIGFAAFSNTLTISSTANVNPNTNDFSLVFANNTNVNELNYSSVYPVNNNPLGENGTIDNSGNPKLSGLKANFTSPGQSVSYKVYVVNTGKYDAYLTDLNFIPVVGSNYKVCQGLNGTTSSLVTAACNDITVSVMVGGTDGVGGTTYSSGSNEITGKSIAPNGNMEVYVTISYADNTISGGTNHYVDGPMTVVFGDIALQYRSTPTSAPIVVEEEEPTIPEYIVDSEGVITAYTGDDDELEIPSSLPYYIEGDEMFYSDRCVELLTVAYSGDSAQAVSDCEDNELDYNTNGENAAEYAGLVEGYVIAPKYIPTGINVTVIGIDDDVFSEKDLTSVELPNTLQTIGNQAFMYNGLTSIEIPDSVTSIGYSAFLFNNLTTVEIGNGITSIGPNAFADDEDTEEEYGPNALETVSINVSCDTYRNAFTRNSQFSGFNGTTGKFIYS